LGSFLGINRSHGKQHVATMEIAGINGIKMSTSTAVILAVSMVPSVQHYPLVARTHHGTNVLWNLRGVDRPMTRSPDDPIPQKIPKNFLAGKNPDTRERHSPQKWLPFRSMRSTACDAAITQL
jgi:hypothetical protein